MKKLSLRILIMLFMVMAGAPLYAKPIADQGDAWSSPVNGIQGRLSFEQGEKIDGKTIIKVFLELRNVSDVLNPVEIYYDPDKSIKAQLLDDAGKPVAQPPVAADIISPGPYYLVLPNNSTLRFDITTYGYSIASTQKFHMELTSGAWAVENPEDYFLEASFTAEKKSIPDKRTWNGVLVLPTRRVSLLKK